MATETSSLPTKFNWSELGEVGIRFSRMTCFTHAIEIRTRGILHREQVKLMTHVRPSSHKSGTIVMRDRSKNRKPLQKGRSLSIEAIQTVQALKRAAIHSNRSLEQVFDDKFRRLLKFDMIAVLRELLRQNQCLLAVQVFEDVRREDWYKPQLSLYAEMLTVLGRNGFVENVELLIHGLKGEDNINAADLEGFNALLKSLMDLNLAGLAMECFYLMKSLSCDPDRHSFKILIDGLKLNGESSLLDVVHKDAKKCYGNIVDFLEDETDVST